MIDQIIKNKIPCYFISPHLDDAVFSAGGLLDKLSGKVDLTVINVFTNSGDSKNTLSARAYLKQCQEGDPSKLFAKRRKEDKVALKTWKVKVVDLPYADAMWRKTTPLNLGLPELTSVYPTYRFHVISGRVSRFDHPLMIDLAAKLKSLIKEKNYYVFCPVGFGNHADHLLVRNVCRATFASDKVFYWSDFPYYFRNQTGGNFIKQNQLDSFEVKHNGVKKLVAAKLYKTQFSAVVTDESTIKNPEIFYHNLVGVKQSLTLSEKINNHLFALVKYPKDYLYSFTYKSNQKIHIKPWDKQAKKVADLLIAKIKRAIPLSTPELIGSTGLGIVGQGDVDLLIPARQRDFSSYLPILTKLFGKPQKISHSMIQWKLKEQGISIDLDLIDVTSPRYNEQIHIFNILNSSREILKQYEDFKNKMNGASVQEYDRGQIKFFDSLLHTYAKNVSSARVLPPTIGGYTLVREVLKDKQSKSYLYGTYKNSLGHLAFAKVWVGAKKDRSYKELLNEIKLYDRFKNTEPANPSLPHLIHSVTHNDLLVLLLEYIEGTSPSNLDETSQLKVYGSVIESIRTLGDSLTSKRGMKVRGPIFWALIFPVISMLALIRNLRYAKNILVAILAFYKNIITFLFSTSVVLTHRDLGKWNILVDKKKTWVFDLQLMGMMHPLIEHVVISLKLFSDPNIVRSYWRTESMQKILASNSQLKLFRSYSILFSLYDLALPSGGDKRVAISYLSESMQLVPKAMNTSEKFKKVGVVLAFVFFALILGLSVRGNQGNSDPALLNTPAWKENGPFELSPERGRFALTYSILEDKSFFFSVPLARFVTPDLGYHDGHYVSLFAPAVSYIVIPGYLIGKYFGSAQVGAFSVIALFALINSILIYGLVRRFGGAKIAGLLSGAMFLFATPSFAYGVNLYQHHISSFLILASLYLVLTFNNWFSLTLVWLLCAASIPVDYPNLILMLPIGIYGLSHLFQVVVTNKTEITIKLWRIFTFLSMALPLSFFLWFNNASYGNPLQFSGTVASVNNIDPEGNPVTNVSKAKEAELDSLKEEKHEKTAVGFFKSRNLLNGLTILLFSPDRGVLYFAPILLIAIIGIAVLYRTSPGATVLLTSVATLDILLYSLWGDPWGGWAFGARYLIPSYAVLSVFIGSALTKYAKKFIFILIFLPLAGYSLYVNVAGALSTSANPPQVQVLSLEALSGRRERYSFDRNIEYLQQNTSKSYLYRVYFHNYLSSWQYFEIIYSSLIGLVVIAVLALYFGKKGRRS